MAFCCQLLLLPQTTASHYSCRHCCHCLRRCSSGKAGVGACGGGNGNSSSVGSGGGSGAILFLIVVVILLLFACPLLVGIVLPLFVTCCSFRRSPLARFQHQHTMVGCWLLRSRSRPSIFAPIGRFLFRFLPGIIFRNPRNSVESAEFHGTHVGNKSFQGKINLLWNPTESRIRPEFRRVGPLTWYSVPRVTNIH